MAGGGEWPKAGYTAGNAGVMVVGRTAQHQNLPVALLGGRWYGRKGVYCYTDFGGGVDRKQGETPHQGAMREFAEELFGLDGKAARDLAVRLCAATASKLVGCRPFIHRSQYAMFIVPAEAVVESLQLPGGVGDSAIDALFSAAKRNSELTSVAMVSIEELLGAASCSDGTVHPVCVRQLDDGHDGSTGAITLRGVLVGQHGSILTIRDALESFLSSSDQPADPVPAHAASPPAGGAYGDGRDRATGAEEEEGPAARRARGGAAPPEDELSSSVDAYAARVANADPAGAGASTPPPARPGAAPRGGPRRRAPYVLDMETGDPDDVLTLLFLATCPGVELRAVTVTPGSAEQVALVRWLLQQVGMAHVRLGAGAAGAAGGGKGPDLRSHFYRQFGRSERGEPACERADLVLAECCDASATLVTGGPLHNLGAALAVEGFSLGRWVAQGGFAGEGVVPPEKQMRKFRGKETCHTWNFGGSIPAAQAALASAAIGRKVCVSKNVCHAVVYDDKLHAAMHEALLGATGQRAVAFRMIYTAMDQYLRRKPGGKALHDPLAMATALDESVCELAEVDLFCRGGQWGSRLRPGSGVWISVSYDETKFLNALLR